METLRRALRNILAQLGSQAVTWGATLVFTAALGRYLGDTGFGVLYLATAFTGVFAMLVDYGLEPLISREIARGPEHLARVFMHGLAIKGALWLLAFVGIQLGAAVLDYPDETRLVITIYTLTLGANACSSLLGSIYAGLERLGPTALGHIIAKVLNAVVGVALLARGAGVVEMAWVLLVGATAQLVFQAAVLAPHLKLRVRLEPGLLRSLIVGGWPFAVYSVLSVLYWRIDAVMLSKMTDEAVIGWYGAAYRLFDTLIFLPNIVAASVMMPVLSRLAKESPDAMRQAFRKGLDVLLLGGIPICAGLFVLAAPILELIYQKPEFLNATPALQALAVGLLVLYVNSAVGWTLVSLDLEHRLPRIFAAAALMNISLNLIAIPLWQHVGAAAATVLSEMVVGAAFIALLPPGFLVRSSLVIAVKASLGSTVMALGLLALRDAAPLPVLVILGAAIYAAVGLLLRIVPAEDLALLRRAFGGRGGPRAVEELEAV